MIRKFQPDVMITRFPEDSRAGHGHHSGSAVLAREAFIAAADPNRFPEQFKYGVKPWQAKRIMWNTFNFGGNNTTNESQLKIDVGTYNAVLGKSYGEMAAESRSQHKSQGFGVPRSRGQQFEYFKLTLGDSASKDILDGVITDWSRVEGGAAIATQIDAIIKNYSFDNPSASVDALLSLYKTILKLQLADNYWRERKMQEVQQLIEACAGLYAEGTTTEQYVAQGDTLKINYTVIDRSNTKIVVKGYYQFDGNAPEGDTYKSALNELNKELEPNKNFSYTKTILIDPIHEISQPYWLKEEMTKGSFNVSDQKLIGMAQNKPSLEVVFVVNIGGEDFYIRRPVQYKFTDPVKGELFQPLVITPGLSIKADKSLLIFDGIKQKPVNVSIRAFKDVANANSVTVLSTPRDYTIINSGELKKGNEKLIPLTVEMRTGGKLKLYANSHAEGNNKTIHEIKYDHIPNITYFTDAAVKTVSVDYKATGKNIGYIVGAGDKVPDALTQMGYTVTMLGEKDLTFDNLKKYDAVVAGVRTYNVHDYMVNAYDALMEYVKQGGVYVVQYNTNSFAGPLANGKIGPAAFTITRNRITDEEAKVNFLQPNHPVLNYPNKITEKDFDGWIQERSIYEADKVDSSYASVLSFNDPGEQPTSGSLIVTNYGKGKWIYLLTLPTVIILTTLSIKYPTTNDLIHDWCRIFYWLSFVLAGFICIASPTLMDSLERNRRTSFALAFLTIMFINYLRWNKHEPSDTNSWTMYAYIAVYAFTAWFWVMTLIGYGKRYLNKKHRVLNYLNQAVYPFYILHQTVIVIIVYYVVQTNDTILLKYLFTLTVSFAITICVYHLFIRPYAVMRFFILA